MTPEQKAALQRAAIRRAEGRMNSTGLVGQGMSGVNEGIGQFFGMPVDIAESAINLGVKGINKVIGTEIPELEGSFGGSKTTQDLMDPFVADDAPDSTAERYARRIGQELGFGVPAAVTTAAVPGLGVAARSNMPGYMAANATADVAAGTAGQTSREIAPENDIADIIATLLAGGSTAALTAGKVQTPGQPIPTVDELWQRAKTHGESARNSGVTLTQDAQDRFYQTLDNSLADSNASPVRHPRAFDVVEEAQGRPATGLMDVDDTRYAIGRDVAGHKDEAGIGMALKEATEEYLNNLTARDATGGDVVGAVESLTRKRQLAHAAHKANEIIGKEYRGHTRAGSAGTGGNQVNAVRQNIRSILDNEVAPTRPGRRHGYSPEEVSKMEEIVMGSPTRNFQRMLGRYSPTAGMLPGAMSGTGVGVAAAGTGISPWMALAAAPAGVGYIAKGMAERGTKRDIAALLETVLNEGAAPKKGVNALIAALLAQSQSGALPASIEELRQ
jgi:hypothetical protein